MSWSVSDADIPWVILVVLGTIGFILFDIARKTIFLEVSWNYDYPAWTFIYNPFALGALLIISVAILVGFNRLIQLDEKQYLLFLFGSTVVISALAFFATPEKSYRWALTPDVPGPVESFQYYPSTIAAEDGIRAFFSQFHSAPTLSGSDRLETTRYLAEYLRNAEFLPQNDAMAEYASNIITQRHGPVPGLLVAPFLVVLGSSSQSAVIGSYAITLTLPILTYLLLGPYFDERTTRIGTLFILFAPAFLIYQRYGTISYDAITAVVTTVALILFMNACRTDRRWVLALSGIVFSGAMLSKISILTVFMAFGVLILVYAEDVRNAVTNLITFGVSTLVVPVSLMPLGYNFVIQYMYDIARIQSSAGTTSGNPLFEWLVSVYNIRLLGAAILAFAALFIVSFILEFTAKEMSKRDYVALAFSLPAIPFLVFTGITLSRHLLPLISMIVFVGLWGVDRVLNRQLSSRDVQLLLGVTVALVLVNL